MLLRPPACLLADFSWKLNLASAKETAMLVLTRKLDEQIKIGDDITITIIKLRNNQIRIGIEAPKEVRVLRGELEAKSDQELAKSSQPKQAAQASKTEKISQRNRIAGLIAANVEEPTNQDAAKVSLSGSPQAQVCDGMVSAEEMEKAGRNISKTNGSAASHADVAPADTVNPVRLYVGTVQPETGEAKLKSAPLSGFFTAP